MGTGGEEKVSGVFTRGWDGICVDTKGWQQKLQPWLEGDRSFPLRHMGHLSLQVSPSIVVLVCPDFLPGMLCVRMK